jgi:hypothetical protein
VLCEFQYGCLALCGLASVVVLRSFVDRVKVFAVSVSLSPSLGRIQPWLGIKLVIPAVSTASYLVLKPTIVKIGPSPYRFISVLIIGGSYTLIHMTVEQRAEVSQDQADRLGQGQPALQLKKWLVCNHNRH